MATNLNLTDTGKKGENLPAGENSPHFGAADRALSEGFIANVKEFLFERPVKIHGHGSGPTVFTHEEFGTGFVANLKEYFSSTPKAARGSIRSPMAWDWQPWYRTFWQNLRDTISPPKLPPLKVSSQPVKVKDIWSKDKAFGPSQAIALAFHIGITALVFSPLLY